MMKKCTKSGLYLTKKKKIARPAKNIQDAPIHLIGPEQLSSSVLGWRASRSLPTTGDSMLKSQRWDSMALWASG